MERASRISLDNNVTHRWDFTNTNEREVTLSLQEPVAVGSGKTVRVGASVQKAKVRVPYRVRLLTAQGRTVTIGGSWEGTTFYNLRAVPREARGRRKDICREESCFSRFRGESDSSIEVE
ncbi:hypothetical protein XENTR_v10010548 [Xenopus tropicalis]|nr:hypothetical protein XENTR_v10010548 [Xenopus tropicalis]